MISRSFPCLSKFRQGISMPKVAARSLFSWPCLLLPALLLGCVTERRIGEDRLLEARSATQMGRWDLAQEHWSEILALSKGTNEEARFALGYSLVKGGSPVDAIRILRGGGAVEDREVAYQKLLARAHMDAGQVRSAGSVFSLILAKHPTDRETLHAYGMSILDTGRGKKGVGLLLRALRIHPGVGDLATRVALRARGLDLFPEEAEAWRIRLQSPNPPAEAYLGAANSPDPSAYPIGEWLEAAVAIDPQFGDAWERLGDWHAAREETSIALDAWKRAVQVDPANGAACLKLAQWHAGERNCGQARQWANHALGFLEDEEERAPFEEVKQICPDPED